MSLSIDRGRGKGEYREDSEGRLHGEDAEGERREVVRERRCKLLVNRKPDEARGEAGVVVGRRIGTCLLDQSTTARS